MRRGAIMRLAAAICAVWAFALIVRWGMARAGQSSVLRVPILDEAAYAALAGRPMGEAVEIIFNGERAALDCQTRTLYISVPIGPDTEPFELEGRLATAELTQRLCFAPDAAWARFAEAVAQNHAFTLLALGGDGTCTRCSVVFTTLPVLCLDAGTGTMDAWAEGKLRLRDAGDSLQGRTGWTDEYEATWHVRGGSTLALPKKSWKITLRRESGQNRNGELLDLGEDDDWILNAMANDDTKLREKHAMDVFALLRAENESLLPMVEGRYVELVMDGRYCGVYLLSRRMDEKYLGLNKETDILLKGGDGWLPASVEEAYEIRYSPLEPARVYALMQPFFEQTDFSLLRLENWIDVELFLRWGMMPDNGGYKNMYYALRRRGSGYEMILIPWDTDMSMGIGWDDGHGFVLAPQGDTVGGIRQEQAALSAAYPELATRLSARWRALREGALSDESLFALLDGAQAQLVSSGALAREAQTWPLRHQGEDGYAYVRAYMENRLAWLDKQHE